MAFSLKTFVLLIVLNSCICQQIADKRANAKTKQILDYIAGLPKKKVELFLIVSIFNTKK
jgi:hypothetical protein